MELDIETKNYSNQESLNLISSLNSVLEPKKVSESGSETEINIGRALFLGIKNIFTYSDFFFAQFIIKLYF